ILRTSFIQCFLNYFVILLYIGLQDLSSAAKMHLTESEDTDP
ncbi:hypothetical protein RUMCAL_02946, partial [Ruminococcus callidus ATCC 27760]